MAVSGTSRPFASDSCRERRLSWQAPMVTVSASALRSDFPSRRRSTLFTRDGVVGADLAPGDPGNDLVGAGDHDDAHIVALAHVASEREPVLAGQADVEQDQRRLRSLELGAHGGAAIG